VTNQRSPDVKQTDTGSAGGHGTETPNVVVDASHRWRRPLAGFLAVIAALSLVLGVTATWMRTTLLDTDSWVAAVEPLPSDPQFQELVAAQVADEVLTLIDLPTLLENAVGPAGKFLAGPVQDASRGFIEDATRKVLASPRFEAVWVEANRVAHRAAVKVLRGEAAAAGVVDGQVTLNLVPLINNVIAQISQDSPELFGGAITVPEVTAEQVDQAATNLGDALGVTIAPDFGQITVFDSQALTTTQRVVRFFDDGVVALWVLFGLSLIGALVASVDRRRTVAALGIVTAVTAVVVWALRRPLEADILNQIQNPSGQDATQIVVDVVLWRNLGPLIWALVAVSLLAAATAFLSGPSNTAVAFRGTVVGLFRGDSHPQTAVSAFMRRHTTAFRVAGAVAALIALFSLSQLTWGWFFTIMIVLAAYEASWIYVAPLEGQPTQPGPA